MKFLNNLNIIIITHTINFGAPHALRDFLKYRAKSLLFIGLPFHYSKDIRSSIEFYEHQSIAYEKKIFSLRLSEYLSYIKDFVISIIIPLKFKRRFDLFIGADCLLALAGILLRTFGFVNKVVFYTIDLSPCRFKNSFLNKLYIFIDKFASENSDIIWNLSEPMVEERLKRGYFRKNNPYQLIVPIGVYLEKTFNVDKHLYKKLVYMGGLSESFGVDLIVRSLPLVKKEVPNFKLIIIGGSLSSIDLEYELKKFVYDNGLKENVEFKGYISDRNEIDKILGECSIGLAPYKPDKGSYKNYCDPTKAKDYMSKGLPVIITDVPAFSKEINDLNAGIVIKYDEKELAEAIISFLTDKSLYTRCRENAIKLIVRYKWDDIFERTLSKSIKEF